jgi:hypothetical protein
MCAHIKELEAQCDDSQRVYNKLLERAFFTKMLFFTAIHKLKGAPNETRKQLAERTEKTLIEREL